MKRISQLIAIVLEISACGGGSRMVESGRGMGRNEPIILNSKLDLK